MSSGLRTRVQFPSVPPAPTHHSSFKRLPAEEGELLRLLLECDGEDVLLTDYASVGKHWNDPRARVSVWLNAKL